MATQQQGCPDLSEIRQGTHKEPQRGSMRQEKLVLRRERQSSSRDLSPLQNKKSRD